MPLPRLRYSLRSLFIVVTLSAVGLAIWSRPSVREKTIAEGKLIERYEARETGPDQWTPSGIWELLDSERRPLVAGFRSGDRDYGDWTVRDRLGRVLASGRIEDGLREGPWVQRYPAGGVKRECHYQRGQLEGETIDYWPSGKERSRGNYTQDKQTGAWKVWHENGQPAAEGAYRDGQRTGSWRFWSAEGNPQPAQFFVQGRAVDVSDAAIARWKERLTGPTSSGRWAAARALGELGEAGVAVLSPALSHEELEVRYAAATALARCGPASAPAARGLVRLLAERDDEVVVAAIVALAMIGPAALEAVPALETVALRSDRAPRSYAQVAMIRIDPEHEAATAGYVKARSDANDAAHIDTLRAIMITEKAWGNGYTLPPAHYATIDRLRRGADLETAAAAAMYLAKEAANEAASESVEPYLLAALEDNRPEVRLAAVQVIRPSGLRRATLEQLERMKTRDPSPAVRKAVEDRLSAPQGYGGGFFRVDDAATVPVFQ